jgi:LPXTG-motif cell wall-anchored protein
MPRHHALRALVVLAFCAAGLTGPVAGPATAADDGNTSFTPADDTAANPHHFFELKVNPGVRVRDRVVLQNHSQQRQTYDIYPADATSVDGAFALSGAAETPSDVGAWLRVPVRRLVLEPGMSRRFTFIVDVPVDASPGDHAGGIVALPRATQAVDGSSNVQLHARYGVGVRVYVTVKGPVQPRLTVSKLTFDVHGGLGASLLGADSATVSYQVVNSGNVMLAPESTGEVTTPISTVRLPHRQLGEMLPRGKSSITEQVDGLRWGSIIGRIHVRVTVTAAGVDPITLEASRWRVPWLSFAGLTLLLALSGGVWMTRRRRRKKVVQVEPPAQELDPVAS